MNYFWKNGEVVAHKDAMDRREVEAADIQDCYSIETSQRFPDQRTGMFGGKNLEWRRIPIEQFPAEFRMHLLLLGVS